MDKHYIIKKTKKYLFFISIVFLVLTWTHLIYKYIYHDSKQVAEKWWSISEAIIWNFPNLNPLIKGNYNDNLVNHILYRSLLTFDTKKNKIIWDITNCDISNLSKIKCFLNQNAKWSDNTDISYDDIIATFNAIQKYNTNPIIASILKNIDIEKKDSSIIFYAKKKDINNLNIFFQPILPAKVINNLSEEELKWNFWALDWIYSGKYVISKVKQDNTLWITNLILTKNENYPKNPAYLDKIIIKIFKNPSQFLKHKTDVNVFNDKNNLIWNSVLKFNNNKYYLNQYIWLFVNQDKIPYPKLRNFILRSISKEEILKTLWKTNFKIIDSIFLDEVKLNTNPQSTTLKEMLNSLWYYKKETIIKKIWNKLNNNFYSQEAKIKETKETSTWTTQKNNVQKITKDNYIKDSKIIISPKRVDNYNYITNKNITLTWKVEELVDNIYINNNKANYTPWENFFTYNLSNLKIWENKLNIYFEKNNEKKLKETVTFFYNKNKEKLKEYEENLLKRLNKEAQQKKLITKITKQKEKFSSWFIQKLNNLEPNFYYNDDLEAYSLNLYYIWNNNYNKKIANKIKEKLESFGIKINLQEITISSLTKMLKAWEKNYDLLLAWINLWYFNFNIFPYFHSSQIENWFNFSKIKKLSLDQMLEELKSYNLSKEKRLLLEVKINEEIKNNAIFKPLLTPLYSNLVDKNINWYKLPNKIPSDIYTFDPLIKSYIIKRKIIDYDNKSITNFFKYLIKILF